MAAMRVPRSARFQQLSPFVQVTALLTEWISEDCIGYCRAFASNQDPAAPAGAEHAAAAAESAAGASPDDSDSEAEEQATESEIIVGLPDAARSLMLQNTLQPHLDFVRRRLSAGSAPGVASVPSQRLAALMRTLALRRALPTLKPQCWRFIALALLYTVSSLDRRRARAAGVREPVWMPDLGAADAPDDREGIPRATVLDLLADLGFTAHQLHSVPLSFLI
jgi:hypothetical protein